MLLSSTTVPHSPRHPSQGPGITVSPGRYGDPEQESEGTPRSLSPRNAGEGGPVGTSAGEQELVPDSLDVLGEPGGHG